MQWSTEPHGGFTKHERPVVPVISGGPYGYQHCNVAQQRRDPNSMLNWTERMLRMRKETPEIGWGDFAILKTDSPEVLALRYDWRGNSVLVVHNLSGAPREVWLEVGDASEPADVLINLLSEDHSRSTEGSRHCVLLEGYGYHWYRVGSLDYLLARQDA